MPRPASNDNSRVALRIHSADKALLMCPVALEHTDLTTLIVQNAMRAARTVIEAAERVALSGRDSLRVLELLENPPPPNERLSTAAQALPAQ